MAAGAVLRIALPGPATVRWTRDGWATLQDTPTPDTGFGLHVAEVDPAGAEEVVFTWRWADGSWTGANQGVRVGR